MLRDRFIICIGSSWDYDPTSKHHIMKILSRQNRILWINYHGSRRPVMTRADFRDGCRKLRRVTRGIHRVSPSIAQLTPMVIPGAKSAPLLWVHRRMLIAQIRRAIRTLNAARPLPVQVWSFAPDVPHLVDAFDEECFLYYCVDEFSEFEGYASDQVLSAEHELLDRADIVITSSQALLERKSLRRPDAVLVRHGVDFGHFASAWKTPGRHPHDLATIPKPIFGYFGLIHHWVDLELLAEVAKLRPLYSFVLIGDCKVDTSRLSGLSNVFLLGRRAYEDLPAYCRAFDGALMLFTNTTLTPNINPIKMYEYLAAGLPVVSTPLPEAERFEGPITIAPTPRSFAEACDHVLLRQTQPDQKTISKSVEGETWESKVEHLSNIVMRHIHAPIRSASMPRSDVGPWRTSVAERASAVSETH